MNIHIREYQAKDQKITGHLQGLLQDHAAHLDPINNYRYFKDFDAEKYCKLTLKNIQKNKGVILLATHEEKVVGLIIGVIDQYNKKEQVECYPSKNGHILEFIVLKEYRNKKIGTKLLKAMEEYFKKAHCDAIQVDCFSANKNAHEFYKNFKYQDRLITLYKKL